MSAGVPVGYRQTEIGVIPEDWDVCCLGDLGDLKMGRGLLKSDISPYGDIPAIPYTSLYTDFSEIIDIKDITWFTNKERAPYIVESPCVLLASSSNVAANTGKACALTTGFPVAVGREVISFRTNQNVEFISYLLGTRFYRKKTLDLAKGITIRHVYPATFINYEIALPSFAEQAAIAKALGDVNALIRGLDQLIAKKRDIKQAAMQQLLAGQTRLPGFSGEWEVKRLGDVATPLKGSSLSKSDVSIDGERKCILYGELFTRYSRVIHSVYSRTDSSEGVPSRIGDVLLPGSTTTTGIDLACASAVFEDDVSLGGDINIIRPIHREQINSAFLANYLTSIAANDIAERAQGITIIHLYGRDLKSLEVKMPHVDEQTAIADALSDMESEISALEARRDKAKQLKQGMMQELLTGRIRLI